MAGDDLADLIESVGDRMDLTAYEIEAYLTVLERGSIAASTLAEETSIPQPRIYDTVRSLSERGFVELHESRPMTVVAVEPAEALQRIESSIEDLFEGLQAKYTAPTPDMEAVSLVKSRATILRHLGELIDATEYELAISLSPRLLDRYENALRAARDREVSIELLVSPSSRSPDPAEYPYRELATAVRTRRGVTTPILAIGDGERSIYATQEAVRTDADRYGVIFNRSELGFVLFGFFGTVLWSTAEPIDRFEPAMSFPRRYASVRKCIKDLQAHEDPSAFTVAVDGRWVTTGDPCHISGPLRGIEIESSGQTASLVVETSDGMQRVGGRVAALEDVEAHELIVQRRDQN